MRDALSILDKIVSFTNGELTYTNTLEHLNILDEDYYFRLLDHMQQQQLSETMLLFDEINRKGFEGDLVLEGFSEFIRNILVSSNAKAAILLEVSDDFKQKYLEAAQKVNTAWLVAALNILNDAGINYKQARNKRLHVELALIRLSYLSQAIELVSADGSVVKKKIVEGTRSVAFRALQPIEVKTGTPATGAKLVIEEEKPVQPKTNTAVAEKTAVIPASTTTQTKAENVKSPSLGSLQKIRQRIKEESQGNDVPVKELNEEELHAAWGGFIEKLVKAANHSAVTNFKLANLKVVDANFIEIETQSPIQQKFIDSERAALVEHLQSYFNNKMLTYQVVVVEGEKEDIPQEKVLTRKDQFLKIIEEYPLVKELKDRLKLELE